MGRKSAVKRDREITKLKNEVSVLSTRLAVLSGGYRVLREEKETIERAIEIMQENSEFKLLTLKEHAEMLKVITELLQPALNDITTLKRSNFYYQIKSLSNNLDYTQQIIIAIGNRIDELENTAWRRFCRWIGRK